jgi:hypothetical protein
MEIVDRIKKRVSPEVCFSKFSLDNIRFKKLLGHSRQLINLFEDGKEKLKGEYIFDLHYVTSLLEETTDLLGKIVYNASVLSPGGSQSFFYTLDSYKEVAKETVLSAGSKNKVNIPHKASSSSLSSEPEFRLLEKVTGWFGEPPYNNLMPVKKIIAEIFNHLFQTLAFPGEKDDEAKIVFNNILNRLNLYYFYNIPEFIDDAELYLKSCRPFRYLGSELNSESQNYFNKSLKEKIWTAFLADDYLSLVLWDETNPVIKLDSCIEGSDESDFIFISSGKDIDISEITDRNFSVVNDFYLSYGWSYSLSLDDFQKSLSRIGKLLFKENRIN